MTDAVSIALINGLTVVLPSCISAFFAYRASVHAKRADATTAEVQQQTNGMKNDLVNLTHDAAYNKGVAEGKQQKAWQLLIDADFVPRIMVNRFGVIQMCNWQAVDLLECPGRDQITGHIVEEFIPQRFRAQHKWFRTKYFEHPAPREMGEVGKLSILTRNGVEIPCDISLSPLRGDDEEFVSVTFRPRRDEILKLEGKTT